MYIAVLFIIQKKKPNPNAVQWVNDGTVVLSYHGVLVSNKKVWAMVVPSYLQGIHSKIPFGCPKPQIILNSPINAVFTCVCIPMIGFNLQIRHNKRFPTIAYNNML